MHKVNVAHNRAKFLVQEPFGIVYFSQLVK